MTSRDDDASQIVGTGRHLSPEALQVWTSLLDVSRILDTELEADLVANHDMTHREYEVLVRLDGWGGSLRMAELAGQIEASAPLVSQTVARLEDRGWVSREPDPEDRRGVRAVLSASGRAALKQAAEPHAAIVQTLLIDALGDDVAAVANAMGAVADHLRQHRQGQPCDRVDCPLNEG